MSQSQCFNWCRILKWSSDVYLFFSVWMEQEIQSKLIYLFVTYEVAMLLRDLNLFPDQMKDLLSLSRDTASHSHFILSVHIIS